MGTGNARPSERGGRALWPVTGAVNPATGTYPQICTANREPSFLFDCHYSILP